MPLKSRRQLVAITTELRTPIIEDDLFGELRYSGPAFLKLKSLSPHLVIYIGSFSKMLSPSVRLGWIVASTPVPVAVEHCEADLRSAYKAAVAGHPGRVLQAPCAAPPPKTRPPRVR